MGNSLSLPKYNNDLASFLGDLRSLVFTSQLKIAKSLRLVHTTISRYESGGLLPPAGYMIHLTYLVDERLSNLNNAHMERQSWLLKEVNEALHRNYSDTPLLKDWNELTKIAHDYLNERQGTLRHVDWGEAPDVSVFYGRENELKELKQYIVSDRARLIIIAGMGGIGKTLTVTRLAHDVEPEFQHIVWRSLHNAPTLEYMVQELSAVLLASSRFAPSQSLNQQILRLLEFMQSHRCLIVLDNLESIMEKNNKIGAYLPEYDDYRIFLNTIATTQHQSCVLLTSRDVPREFSKISNAHSLVHAYHLPGLPVTATKSILQMRGVEGSLDELQELNRQYSGNPMAIKLVAETIQSFFHGDLNNFLASESIIFNDIRHLMEESFNRFSSLSHEVLYWLAVERQPVSLDKLLSRLVLNRSINDVIDVLQSLERCSLVEQQIDDRFYVPNVVSEYLIDHLVHQIHDEICLDNLDTLHHIALLTTDSPDYVRQTQIRIILKPLANLFITELGTQDIRARFEHLVNLLHLPIYAFAGYAPGNLLNIMMNSGHEIRNYNFSGLIIQHAHLTKVALTDVDFSNTQLDFCRFDNTFTGINSVAVSKKAQFLALASGSEIRIWRLRDRQPYRILSGHREMIWRLIFAQEEHLLFSRDVNNNIFLWNIEDSRIEFMIPHQTILYALAINPDVSLIATGGEAGIVYLWDGRTGQPHTTFTDSTGIRIRSLAFTASGKYLAVGRSDGTIVLWDIAQASLLATLEGGNQDVLSLAFTQNDELLCSGGTDHTIKIWDMNTLALQSTLSGHADTVSSIKAHPNGKTLVSSSYDKTIKIWDMMRQEPNYVLQGHHLPVSAIDLDESGDILVSGSYDRTVRIWNTQDGHLIDSIQGLTFDFRTLTFSPDSQFIAAGSSDYHIYMWDTFTGTRTHLLRKHLRWVSAVAFNPAGNSLASGSYDRTVRIWNSRTGKELAVLTDHQHWVLALCFSLDGKFLASAGMDCTIRLWSLENDYKLFHTLLGHKTPITNVVFHPHQTLLASSSRDKTVCLWDFERGELIATLPMSADAEKMCFSDDGQRLVCALQNGQVVMWDLSSLTLVYEWQFAVNPVQVMALSANGDLLASYGTGRTVTIWDIKAQQKRREVQANGGPISTLVFDRQAQQLASGSVDGFGNLWDVETGSSIRTFKMNRPYEGLNITDASGISATQREMLKSLGAVEH